MISANFQPTTTVTETATAWQLRQYYW